MVPTEGIKRWISGERHLGYPAPNQLKDWGAAQRDAVAAPPIMEAANFGLGQANQTSRLKEPAMNASDATAKDTAQRLHIGGKQVKEGWKILNIQRDRGVDIVGNAADLSQFNDETFDEVYASHVIEHLGYQKELPAALKGIHRILKPGGVFFSHERPGP